MCSEKSGKIINEDRFMFCFRKTLKDNEIMYSLVGFGGVSHPR